MNDFCYRNDNDINDKNNKLLKSYNLDKLPKNNLIEIKNQQTTSNIDSTIKNSKIQESKINIQNIKKSKTSGSTSSSTTVSSIQFSKSASLSSTSDLSTNKSQIEADKPVPCSITSNKKPINFSKRAFINKLLKTKIFDEEESTVNKTATKTNLVNFEYNKIASNISDKQIRKFKTNSKKKQSSEFIEKNNSSILNSSTSSLKFEKENNQLNSEKKPIYSLNQNENNSNSHSTFGWNTLSGFVNNLFHHKEYQVNYKKNGTVSDKQDTIEILIHNTNHISNILDNIISKTEFNDSSINSYKEITNFNKIELEELYLDDNGEKYDEIEENIMDEQNDINSTSLINDKEQQKNINNNNFILFNKKSETVELDNQLKSLSESRSIFSASTLKKSSKLSNLIFNHQYDTDNTNNSCKQNKILPPKYKPPPPIVSLIPTQKIDEDNKLQDHHTSNEENLLNITEKSITIQKKTVETTTLTNEYSEPFDLLQITSCETSSEQKIISKALISTDHSLSSSPSQSTQILDKNCKKMILTKSNDDSAYSSCYINQSPSTTPKKLSLVNQSKIDVDLNLISTKTLIHNNNEYCSEATDDTLIPFESHNMSTLLSSSSSSSASASSHALPQPKLTVTSEYESVADSITITDSVKEKLNEDQIQEKYEKNEEDETNETYLLKTALKTYDTLNKRCNELIQLFDSDKNPSITSNNNKKIDYEIEKDNYNNYNACSSIDLRSKYLKSTFLERTLTFIDYMTSSALLSSSNSFHTISYSDMSFDSTSNRSDYSTLSSKRKIKCFSSIRDYIFRMSKDEQSLFGKNINEFIYCTTNSKEKNPNFLMSNTRQFMNGIKNYLLKNDINQDLKKLIELERTQLDSTQILNIDSIVEDCLQLIILRPLKPKLYYLLVNWLINDKSLILISKSIKKLNNLSDNDCADYLVLTKREHIPSKSTLNLIRNYYNRMQCEYAPLIKLKYLLFIINELLSSIDDFDQAIKDFANLNVVDFLPIIIFCIVKCGMYAIQIEIDYIWSLIDKRLLTNETIYYLTLMSSACYVIKNLCPLLAKIDNEKSKNFIDLKKFFQSSKTGPSNIISKKNLVATCMQQGLMDIYFPDDNYQTIKMRTIPVKPYSKCKDVKNLISAKFKIFNSDLYGLYLIENGIEKLLNDDEYPLELKNQKLKGNNSLNSVNVKFIYKQKTVNILWPKP